MSLRRRILMVGSVLFAAFAIGFVMQHGSAGAASPDSTVSQSHQIGTVRFPGGSVFTVADREGVASDVPYGIATVTSPALPADPLVSPLPEPSAPRVHIDIGLEQDLNTQPPRSLFGLPCDVDLRGEAYLAGMVRIEMEAPCYSDVPVTIRHGALKATELTDAAGRLSVMLPALQQTARFELQFENGTSVEVSVPVADASEFERVAVQWRGPADLSLHAFEGDADHSTPNHVHGARPYGPARSTLPDAGFLTQLGNSDLPDGWRSDVYTYPRTGGMRANFVEIVLEASISQATCGRRVLAETMHTAHGGPDRAVDLAISMPGCEDVGDVLVLKNLVPDVRLAAN